MPKSATVQIGDRKKPVMVREMTLAELNELMTAPTRPIVEAVAHLLGLCSDITPAELLPYAPSEVNPLIEKMLELNQSFFDQAAALEMTETAAGMKLIISRISMLAYLPLSPETESSPDTESESGATPTECSSTP